VTSSAACPTAPTDVRAKMDVFGRVFWLSPYPYTPEASSGAVPPPRPTPALCESIELPP
jgi:hypothetical protein